MPTLEDRIAAVENRIGMGLFSSNSLDSLQTDVDQLKQLTSRLSALQETGNPIYGGPIKTVIAASWFTQLLQQFNLESGAVYDVELIVPEEFLKILYCKITLYSRQARVDFSGSALNLVSGLTGGPSSHMNGPNNTHTHSLTSGVTGGPSAHMTASAINVPHTDHNHGADPMNGPSSHMTINDKNIPDTNHNHTVANVATGGPTGTALSIPHTDHNHTLGNLSTDGVAVDIRDTGSGLTGGRIEIDAIDRSVALGGPWTGAAGTRWVLDITQYLNDIRGNPILGNHVLRFSATALCGMGINIQWYIIAKNL